VKVLTVINLRMIALVADTEHLHMYCYVSSVHCKKVIDFPAPRESLVSDILAGDRKIENLFYSVMCRFLQNKLYIFATNPYREYYGAWLWFMVLGGKPHTGTPPPPPSTVTSKVCGLRSGWGSEPESR
jgi:hypothetical protein